MKPSLRCNNPRCEAQNPCQRARHVIYSAFWPGLLALERHKKSPAQRPITHRLQLNYTIIATIPSRKIHRLQMGYTIEVNSKRDFNKHGPKKSDRPFYSHKIPLRLSHGEYLGCPLPFLALFDLELNLLAIIKRGITAGFNIRVVDK